MSLATLFVNTIKIYLKLVQLCMLKAFLKFGNGPQRPLKFQRYKNGTSTITHKEDYLMGLVEIPPYYIDTLPHCAQSLWGMFAHFGVI
jgi:hypothetical protein